jgi:hypothetical protein
VPTVSTSLSVECFSTFIQARTARGHRVPQGSPKCTAGPEPRAGWPLPTTSRRDHAGRDHPTARRAF